MNIYNKKGEIVNEVDTMYIYDFRSKHDGIKVYKIIDTKPEPWCRGYDTFSAIYKIDADGHKCGYRVRIEEGVPYRRLFWLQSYDMEEAKKIIEQYKSNMINFHNTASQNLQGL